MAHCPIALWATPRSASTAFDRMMRERGDHVVLTEPFSAAYYYGPDRQSSRFADEQLPASGYADIWERLLLASGERPVFVKDMPHHLGPHLRPESLRRFTNTFLVRDPAWAVPSMLALWPDATDDELGYAAQRRAFDMVVADTGRATVIDSDDLRRDPSTVVAAWCEAVDIEHLPASLSWEPGMPEGWDLWADWFQRAAHSTGFAPPDDRPRPVVSPEVTARIAACAEHYEVLRRARLTL